MGFIRKLWSSINWKSWVTYIIPAVIIIVAAVVVYNNMLPVTVTGESAVIKEEKFVRSFKTNGKALPHIYSDIVSVSDGFVSLIYHNVGDRVSVNTPLIKLSNPDMEKIFTDTELLYNQAKLDYKRDMHLYNKEALTPYEYQMSELKYKQAENNYNKTKEKLFPTSPIDGTVYAVNVSQGQSFRAGTVLMSVGQVGRLEIKIFVDQPDISKLYIGERCEITSDAIPNEIIYGKVVNIPENVINQGARTGIEVSVNLDKGAQVKLLPNTKVNARLIIKETDRTISVPIESVFDDGDGVKYVYKIDPEKNILTKTPVKIGESNDTRYQILSGLKPADKIVVNAKFPKIIPVKNMIFKEKSKV